MFTNKKTVSNKLEHLFTTEISLSELTKKYTYSFMNYLSEKASLEEITALYSELVVFFFNQNISFNDYPNKSFAPRLFLKVPTPNNVDLIEKALASKTDHIRRDMIYALKDYKNEKINDILIAAYYKEPEASYRREILNSLANYNHDKIKNLLEEVLKNTKEKDFVIKAAEYCLVTLHGGSFTANFNPSTNPSDFDLSAVKIFLAAIASLRPIDDEEEVDETLSSANLHLISRELIAKGDILHGRLAWAISFVYSLIDIGTTPAWESQQQIDYYYSLLPEKIVNYKKDHGLGNFDDLTAEQVTELKKELLNLFPVALRAEFNSSLN